jgi:Bacterial Ig-like domain (group 3)
VLYNTRLTDTDVMIDQLIDLATGNPVGNPQAINDRLGDTDTALLDSDTLVMPVPTAYLGLTAGHSRIAYGVASFSNYQSAPVDTAGLNADGDLSSPLSFDPLNPGVAIYGSFNGDQSPLLFADGPGSVLAIRRDTAAYTADRGLGALVVHFHNAVGNKAQVVSFAKATPTVKTAVTPTSVAAGKPTTIKATVTGSTGTPTGTVTFQRQSGATWVTVGSGALSAGARSVSYTPTVAGTVVFRAVYAGDGSYVAGTSASANLTVTKLAAAVTAKLSATSVKAGKSVTITVSVATVNGLVPTGKVTLTRTSGSGAPAASTSANVSGGKATLTYTPKSKGTYSYRIDYAGSTAYNAAHTGTLTLKVT